MVPIFLSGLRDGIKGELVQGQKDAIPIGWRALGLSHGWFRLHGLEAVHPDLHE